MSYHLKCERCDGEMPASHVMAKASLCPHCFRASKIVRELHDEAMGDLLGFLGVLVILAAGFYFLFWCPA